MTTTPEAFLNQREIPPKTAINPNQIVMRASDVAAGRLLPGAESTEIWHIVGDPDPSIVARVFETARRPGKRRVEWVLYDLDDLELADSLAVEANARGVRLRVGFPALELREASGVCEISGSSRVARADTLLEELRRFTSVHPNVSIAAVVPLQVVNAPRVFALWRWLAHQGLAYQFTLAQEDRTPAQRDEIAELLENLSHMPGVALDLSQHYERLRRTVCAEPDALATPVHDPDDDLVTEALTRGLVAVRPEPVSSGSVWNSRARDLKLDKWWTLGRGGLAAAATRLHPPRAVTPQISSTPRVLVVGWYGTETAGDKAILAGLLQEIYARHPETHVTVSSVIPFYTRKTLRELGLGDRTSVIPFDFDSVLRELRSTRLLMMGGGPLMDIVEMWDLVRFFRAARQLGVRTILAGCGVGPAHWGITRWAIQVLLSLSDRVVLRDQDSLEKLKEWGFPTDHVQAGLDPALGYIADLDDLPLPGDRTAPMISMAIRDWPAKFAASVSTEEYEHRRRDLIDVWARVCDLLIDRTGGTVTLLPMHTLHIGDDDRWFHQDVRERAQHRQRVTAELGTYSAKDIAHILLKSDAVITMRYHSLLFSSTLGVPAAAVDYTRGEKVRSFSRHLDVLGEPFDILTIRPEQIVDRVMELLQNADTLRPQLRSRVRDLLPLSRLGGQTAAALLD